MADGTTFQIDIGVQGAAAMAGAAGTAADLATKLEAAGKASTAASEAVKASEISYRQAEAAADAAAKAAERVGVALAAQQGKLAAATAVGDTAGIDRANAKIEALNARQQEAQSKALLAKGALDAEAASLDKVRAAAAGAADSEAKLSKSLEQAKTSAANVAKARAAASGSGKVNEMAEAFGKLGGPLGAAGQKALGAAEGLKKLGASMGSTGPYVAIALAVTAITAAVITSTLAITMWAIKLADKTGQIGKAYDRFNKSVANTFGGLKIKGVLYEMDRVVELFDVSTASGRAMKTVFESLFQPIVDGIAAFIPKMVTAFIKMEILVLKALIAIKPYGSKIVMIGETFAIMGAVAVAAVALVVAALVGIVVLCAAIGIGVQVLLGKLVEGGKAFLAYGSQVKAGMLDPINSAIDFLKNLSLSGIGASLIDGLIAGFLGGGPKVVSAISGLAGDAVTAAKKTLGIASPSKVFAEIGANTAAGMVEGIDGAAPEVTGSLASMVAPPATTTAAPTAATPAPSSGASITGATFIFNGVEGAEDAVARFEAALTKVLEGDASQLGAMVPA